MISNSARKLLTLIEGGEEKGYLKEPEPPEGDREWTEPRLEEDKQEEEEEFSVYPPPPGTRMIDPFFSSLFPKQIYIHLLHLMM